MIKGLGNDIIEIDRIEKAIERFAQKFLDKVFTSREQAYCRQYNDFARHFAGRFAAKEAVIKALGIGFREGITWLDIEIVNDHYGKPLPKLSTKLQQFEDLQLLVTISHCKKYASAVAIAVPLAD